jgi:sulfur carrier protein
MSSSTAAGTITVNRRDTVAWRPGMTVSDLLTEMRFTFPRVVVTVDGTHVPHNAYETTVIPEGADVRVIHLMAGG